MLVSRFRTQLFFFLFHITDIVNYQQIYRDAFAIPIVNFLLEFYSGTLPALILQNQQHLNTFQWIGVVLFVLGGFMETTYELTRKSFKADPKNQGLPYISGKFFNKEKEKESDCVFLFLYKQSKTNIRNGYICSTSKLFRIHSISRFVRNRDEKSIFFSSCSVFDD